MSHTEGKNPSINDTHAVASLFHEGWRFAPRIKKTTDKAWIKAHGTNQVDIANTPYEALPTDWQAENKAAAEVVAALIKELGTDVDLNDPAQRSIIGNRIHEAWLSRHKWARGGALDVPFDQLPLAEQEKDLNQMIIGLQFARSK